MLYAPTHREYQPGYHPLLDLGAARRGARARPPAAGPRHYFYDRTQLAGLQPTATGCATSPRIPSVEELYLAADVLVTDYSSVMFDYAVLDRPIVVYAPDWEAYRLARGVNFDLTGRAAGRGRHDFADLLDLFRTGAVDATRRPRPGRGSGPGSARSTTATPPSGWSAGSSSANRPAPAGRRAESARWPRRRRREADPLTLARPPGGRSQGRHKPNMARLPDVRTA